MGQASMRKWMKRAAKHRPLNHPKHRYDDALGMRTHHRAKVRSQRWAAMLLRTHEGVRAIWERPLVGLVSPANPLVLALAENLEAAEHHGPDAVSGIFGDGA